jgi:hypothetical protein
MADSSSSSSSSANQQQADATNYNLPQTDVVMADGSTPPNTTAATFGEFTTPLPQ